MKEVWRGGLSLTYHNKNKKKEEEEKYLWSGTGKCCSDTLVNYLNEYISQLHTSPNCLVNMRVSYANL